MNYQDLINACQLDWQAYTQHRFVKQLAQGTLAQSDFLHYLKQDFLFLKHRARAYALAIYKSNSLDDMRHVLPIIYSLLDSEIEHHLNYCYLWKLSEKDLENEPENFGTVAYTRYVLDAGMSGDLVDLYTAFAPCSIGYAVMGKNLIEDQNTLIDGNPYINWINLYAGEKYQSGVAEGIEFLNQLLAEIDINSQRGQSLIDVFKTATRMEVAFWQQSLDVQES